MELIIMLVTMILTAVSTTIFIKAEVKKSKGILIEKKLSMEKRFSNLENKQMIILSELKNIETELKEIKQTINPLRRQA